MCDQFIEMEGDYGQEESTGGTAPAIEEEINLSCCSRIGILSLPVEVMDLLLKHLSVFDVSRLIKTCRHFWQMLSEEDLKLALYRGLPLMTSPRAVMRVSKFQQLRRRNLVMTGESVALLRTALRMALRSSSWHLQALMISSGALGGVDRGLLSDCVSRMEVIWIEGVSLGLETLQDMLSSIASNRRARVLILTDQRSLMFIGNAIVRRLAAQIEYLILPSPGSMVDGLAQDQLLELLIHAGRLKKLTLVIYWDLGEEMLDIEIACLLAHFDSRRRNFQRSMARIQTLYGILHGAQNDGATFPDVEQVFILRAGSEVEMALCSMWSNPVTHCLEHSQCQGQIMGQGVPEGLSEHLSLMGWTRVASAETIRREWANLGDTQLSEDIPSAQQHEDSWNPTYSCAALAMFIPLP